MHMKRSIKLLSFFLGYSRWLVGAAIAAGLLAGASSAALMILINAKISNVSSRGASLAAFAGFAILVLFSTTASGVLSSQLAQRSSLDLRLFICKRILASPLRDLELAGEHKLLTALTQDIMVVISAFLRVPPFFINIAIVTGGLVYLAWLSPVMLMVLVGLIVVAIASYLLPQGTANKYLKVAREEYANLVDHFRAVISGSKELKLHQRRRHAFFDTQVERTAVSLKHNAVMGEGIYVLLNAWSQVLYFVVIGLVLFASPLLIKGAAPAVLTGYALTVLYISAPIQALVNIVPALSLAAISYEKLEELGLSLKASDVKEREGLESEKPATWRSLELAGATHSYYREREPGEFILGPINLSFERGELVFLVGGNGSGKTTLAKLLCGLYSPEAGSIKVDGVDVREQDIDDYRQYFSVVFTEFHLFEQLLGLEATDLDGLARDYLGLLELDHKVTVEDGKLSTTKLSYGQRKRLALLTAYLEDRSFYIFDEWAADQDPVFKAVFYEKLLPGLKAKGKTVLVISHDDRYYYVADRIIKLEYGKLEHEYDASREEADVDPEYTSSVALPGVLVGRP